MTFDMLYIAKFTGNNSSDEPKLYVGSITIDEEIDANCSKSWSKVDISKHK